MANQRRDQTSAWRSNHYRVLARLLAMPVDQALLTLLLTIESDHDSTAAMNKAWKELSSAAKISEIEDLSEQYQDLFIGVTRGQLLAYGSFYQTGFLMEKPLARLRADLQKLGMQRQSEVCEPEDHISALCEVMSILVQENRSQQKDFFDRHLNNWADTFFNDLVAIKTSPFYRAVGQLGLAFFNTEAAYLISNHHV